MNWSPSRQYDLEEKWERKNRILGVIERLLQPRSVGAMGLVLVYLYAGFMPFRWNPPRWMLNGASVTEGFIRLPTAGLLESKDPAWFLPVLADSQFQVQLRVRPLFDDQVGPARIFTISQNTWYRNFTLGQLNHDLVVRLRTPATDFNGIPEYTVHDVFLTDNWRDLDVQIADDQLVVRVDGKESLRQDLPKHPLSNWEPLARTAVGNEPTWDRPWLGEISFLRTTVAGREQDWLESDLWLYPQLLLPEGKLKAFTFGPYLAGRPRFVRDAVLNLLGYIPLGIALTVVIWRRSPFLWGIVLSMMVSGFVEVGQFCIDGRYPSIVDFSLNGAGAVLGAFIGICWRRIRARPTAIPATLCGPSVDDKEMRHQSVPY